MKRRIMLLPALMLFAVSAGCHTLTFSLEEAMVKHLAGCEIRNLTCRPDSLSFKGGHVLELALSNLHDVPLRLRLESGRTFESVLPGYQGLITTEERAITLRAGEERKIQLASWCINQSLMQPSGNSYRVGKLADGLLLKLANFLGKRGVYNTGAQAALWVITDNASIGQVVGRNTRETRLLRSYLYSLTGLPRPSRSVDPLSYPAVSLRGSITWSMQPGSTVSLLLTEPGGSTRVYLFRDKSFPPGQQRYDFEFLDDALLPEQVYLVSVLEHGVPLAEKTVRARE